MCITNCDHNYILLHASLNLTQDAGSFDHAILVNKAASLRVINWLGQHGIADDDEEPVLALVVNRHEDEVLRE